MSDDRVQSKREAERLLKNPVLVRAFALADQKFVQEWRSATKTQTREEAHAKVKALDEVQNMLRIIVADGALEDPPDESLLTKVFRRAS